MIYILNFIPKNDTEINSTINNKNKIMKHLFLLLSIIFLVYSSFGQRKIKKLDVFEKGYNIKINFEPVKNKFTYNQAEFIITPISGDELNSFFLEESGINGRFEYSFYNNSRSSYFLKKNRKIEVKSDFDFLNLGLEWLLENEIISEPEYEELFKKLTFYYNEKTAERSYFPDDVIIYNPYYIANRFLSVFKIEITNPTNSFLTFDKEMLLQSGNVIYSPLSKEQIIKELQRSNSMNVDKSLLLGKYNLQDTLVIPPISNFIKYFAVSPIKYYKNKLEISIPDIGDKLSWNVTTDEKFIDEKYTYYEFEIDWSHDGSVVSYADVFSILTTNHSSLFLGNDEMYIGEDSLNEKFEIFTLSLWGNTLYYGRNSDLKGIDYIDVGKGRRSSITIQTEKISDIKRK